MQVDAALRANYHADDDIFWQVQLVFPNML